MLNDCSCSSNLVTDLKRGQMPSADKITSIAQYLEVSTDFLMGATNDPTPPKKELTLKEKIAAQCYILTADEEEQLMEYLEFLKIKKERQQRLQNGRTEISSELRPEL